MKIEFNGRVNEDGILKIFNRKIFDALIHNFKNKDIVIEISSKKKNRSSEQNRYYWGIVVPIFQQGFFENYNEWQSKEEIHEFIKQHFNYKEIVNNNSGEVLRLGSTTTDLSTTDFEILMDKCRFFADDFFNIKIPLPNEQSKLTI